jgi:hypothetical protein
MLRRGWARLDVTGGRHRLYLGTHVPNSVGRTGTMLLDPRATPNEGICWPYRMPGRDVVLRHLPVAPVMDRGIMTKTATPTCSTRDRHNHNMCMPSLSSAGPAGPARGGEGQHSLRAVSSSIFFYFFFSSFSLSCT